MQMKRKFREEKGSIAVYVTIVLLSFIIVLTTIYFSSMAVRRTQLKTVLKVKETYEQKNDDIEGIYQEQVAKISPLEQAKADSMLTKTENTKLELDSGTVWIPAGFKVHEDTAQAVDEGIVIVDEKGNEFVWVPVDDTSFNAMFGTATEPYYLCGQSGDTGVKTNYYSNLRVRSGDNYVATTPGTTSVTVNSSRVNGVREPDLVIGSGEEYDASTTYKYYEQAGNYKSTAEMAQAFVDDYKNMRASIEEYDGFYIGRYELTGTVDNPTVQAGEVLTASSSQAKNWYGLYKACRDVKGNDKYVTSTMIWGCQWDETMNWIKNTKFNGDSTYVDSDSTSWGNYKDSSGNAQVKEADETTNAYGKLQNTGYSEYWSANKIYDLAGNYLDWTQEAVSTSYRKTRGGYYDDSGSGYSASSRISSYPNKSYSDTSARTILYINL